MQNYYYFSDSMQHKGRISRNLVEGEDAIRCLSRMEKGDLAMAGFYLARRSDEIIDSDPEKAARLLRAAELNYIREITGAVKENDPRWAARYWHLLGDFYNRLNNKKKAAFAYGREISATRRADGIKEVHSGTNLK